HGKTTEESVRYRTSRALENFALRRADHITTICEGLRAEILSRGIASDRVTVIPNAVDGNELRVETMNDPVLRAQLGLEGKMDLGFAGSFYAYEGLDLLIDAIAMLAPRNPKLRVLLVGDGPQAGNLKAMVKERGLQNRVFFTGSVPHGDVRRYYGLIDVLIYPRHRMRLTEIVTPLKPLEAMAYGRIFLASDVGGHRELVRDGETGFLFPAGDARALAHAIEKIIAEPALWPRVREQARRFVEKERTWSRSVARYADIYAALCAPAMARGSHLKHAGN
ncbi:MAG: glycosyltransferase, partial [Betaproteobacteria bacterium]